MMMGSPILVSFLCIHNLIGTQDNRWNDYRRAPRGNEIREPTHGWVAEGRGDTSEGKEVGGSRQSKMDLCRRFATANRDENLCGCRRVRNAAGLPMMQRDSRPRR